MLWSKTGTAGRLAGPNNHETAAVKVKAMWQLRQAKCCLAESCHTSAHVAHGCVWYLATYGSMLAGCLPAYLIHVDPVVIPN